LFVHTESDLLYWSILMFDKVDIHMIINHLYINYYYTNVTFLIFLMKQYLMLFCCSTHIIFPVF
jgi:hypothetical protein